MRPGSADPKTDFVLKRIFGAHQARMAGLTPAEWDAYDRAQISEQDARGAISLAERQGEARGEARGFVRGQEQGRGEGLAEGLREAIRGVCQALEIELSAEREAALDSLEVAELQDLKARLLRERRWS
jgi:hypothetical protein